MPDNAVLEDDGTLGLARAALDLANTLYWDAWGPDLWNPMQREPAMEKTKVEP